MVFFIIFHVQGHVKTKQIKRGAKLLIQKHYNKLNLDFNNNKQVYCVNINRL